jgi:hypothetical protein
MEATQSQRGGPMNRLTSLALATAITAAVAGPALAHHSVNAQFDTSRMITITGVLQKMEDINPHSQWEVVVKNAQGQAEVWKLESLGAAALRRQGVKVKDEIKVGDTYTFICVPPWDGSHTGNIQQMVINGRTVVLSKL